MYNLYQSQLRKDIQHDIYRKSTFTVELFGKEYFGTIKEKKLGPFTLRRYQIMGVEFPNDKEYVREELAKLKKKFRRKGIFFQLGMINDIISFENISQRSEEFKQDMRNMRIHIREYITKLYGLKVAFRENMPQANIVYDSTKSDEELIGEMNGGCKERVKKAMKKGIEFGVAGPDQYQTFYQKWKELGGTKGFHIITPQQYERLIRYITQNNCGNLFTSHIDGDIIAGSICIYDQHRIIYLYGFSNRKYSNIGGHHYLKFKIFGYAREHGMTYVDMLGGAPTGFPEHSLYGVSQFKESLGGTKIEQYGSYDVVLNRFLYWVVKLWYKLKN